MDPLCIIGTKNYEINFACSKNKIVEIMHSQQKPCRSLGLLFCTYTKKSISFEGTCFYKREIKCFRSNFFIHKYIFLFITYTKEVKLRKQSVYIP